MASEEEIAMAWARVRHDAWGRWRSFGIGYLVQADVYPPLRPLFSPEEAHEVLAEQTIERLTFRLEYLDQDKYSERLAKVVCLHSAVGPHGADGRTTVWMGSLDR